MTTVRTAIALTGLLVGASAAAAQTGSATTSPGPPARAFATLFAPPATRSIVDPMGRPLKALPPGTKCHLVIVPPDPRIDPRMSIEPSGSTRLFLRAAPVDRVCR